MTTFNIRRRGSLIAGLAAIGIQASLAPAQVATMQGQPTPSDVAAMAKAKADSVNRPYTRADIDFMRGMIAHHAQAIIMAGWRRRTVRGRRCRRCAIASSTRRRTRSTSCRRGCATARQAVPEAKPVPHEDDDERRWSTRCSCRACSPDEQLKELDAARGTRVRQALSQGHDPAPPGRRVDGEDLLLATTAPRRTSWSSSSRNDVHVDQVHRDRAHAADARADHASGSRRREPAARILSRVPHFRLTQLRTSQELRMSLQIGSHRLWSR